MMLRPRPSSQSPRANVESTTIQHVNKKGRRSTEWSGRQRLALAASISGIILILFQSRFLVRPSLEKSDTSNSAMEGAVLVRRSTPRRQESGQVAMAIKINNTHQIPQIPTQIITENDTQEDDEEENVEAPLVRKGFNAAPPKSKMPFSFHKEWHPGMRSERFPSVEDRIRLYAGEDAWLRCACSKNHKSKLPRTHMEHPERIHTFPREVTNLANTTFAIPSLYKLGTSIMPKIESSILDTANSELEILYLDQNVTFVSTKLRKKAVSILERSKMETCVAEKWRYHQYCKDSLLLLDFLNETTDENLRQLSKGYQDDNLSSLESPPIPVFVKFGDSDLIWDVDLPVFKKFRTARGVKSTKGLQYLSWDEHVQAGGGIQNQLKNSSGESYSITNPDKQAVAEYNFSALASPQVCEAHVPPRKYRSARQQPIIWPFETDRHFASVSDVVEFETKWEHKLPMAVWRGALTGRASSHIETVAECLEVPRCRLVYQFDLNQTSLNYQHKLVSAKFASSASNKWTVGTPVIDDHPNNTSPPVHNYLNMEQLLQYKAIIVLEGNDVSTGLKWALFSQSVVMMPVPTKTSWAMEEYLQPWVHYIPLRQDLSNVEAQVQWMRDHDDEAKRIAERATLFIYDLLFHPEAKLEHILVREGLLKLYFSCFYS